MKKVLITGCNRGLGLEFTRQYLEAGWRVYATCRRPAEAQSLQLLLKLHSALSIHRLDITVQEDISSIVKEVEGVKLDLLVNNAGVYLNSRYERLGSIDYDCWRRTFEVNTLGCVRVTEGLLENLAASERSGLVVSISSHMGKVTDIEEFGSIYYRSSKAALNTAMQGIAHELRSKGLGVLLLHPGAVMTRMGPAKGISAQESVSGMRQVIESFTMDRSGSFFQYDGQQIAW